MAQYPDITPPTVQVICSYPGANAQVVADTVAAPIEQQVNGVENMLYMSSQCTNDGAYTLTVTFELGTDLQLALVQVQNRVQLAMPQMPEQVQQQGVNIKKTNAEHPAGGEPHLARRPLRRPVPVELRHDPHPRRTVAAGRRQRRQHSGRARLQHPGLARPRKTGHPQPDHRRRGPAVRQENNQVVAGQIGQPPGQAAVQFQPPLCALGRLADARAVRRHRREDGHDASPTTPVTPAGAAARRRPAGARRPAVRPGLPVRRQAVGRAGRLSDARRPTPWTRPTASARKWTNSSGGFPDGLDYSINYDTTPFIRESIVEVLKTLLDAVLLVALVVLVFLQNWRAAVIPLAAMPVAIVGTFAVMAALGFSLNNLSLFGLVLAIGIVVDDAIVVVENVERWLAEGLSPREAAVKAMDEVTGPVIAVALVLCAVFVPCAFISGITGQFFRQFALTIAVSTVISAFNSLTLSPALAAVLLKPHGSDGATGSPVVARLCCSVGSSACSTGAFDRSTASTRAAWACCCAAASWP